MTPTEIPCPKTKNSLEKKNKEGKEKDEKGKRKGKRNYERGDGKDEIAISVCGNDTEIDVPYYHMIPIGY
ncbi:hypothetical protein RhiirB3_449499 [Rhizophagus irregularis]|nr:hypothetical protein RhiirB3_449499 [Rhizophagus irregularis]